MRYERESYRPMLTWSQVAEIAASGLIEVGSHSRTHPQLDTLARADARAEITQSKLELEAAIGQEVASFCYPFGYYTQWLRATVMEAGYTSACATRFMMSSTADDAFALARIMVPHDMSLTEFDSALRGVGLRTAPARPLLTTRMRNLVRCSTVRWARRFHLEEARLEYRLRLIG
jgi:peptidoglycan/xylan/chitin deacetylase (PgdA/CDA1 family)